MKYLTLGLLLLWAQMVAAQQPNILWISCEDIGPHLGCYGYAEADTPHLDALAAKGVRFTNAHTVTGVCATCRASMITGMFPSTLGNQFMRCKVDLPEHVKLFPQYLRDAGYYCTNNSKTDYNITGDHGRCWDESSRKAHFRNRSNPDQPFFAVFNFTNTHESKVFGYKKPNNLTEAELHAPDKMTVPPYHPDTDVARTDWAHYYDNITAMDKMASELLAELEEDGLSDNTIVIFWSDHGAGLPRCKRWIYESGTLVPLIVYIPDDLREESQGEPSTVDERLISLFDLGPTVLNLAGIPVPEHMHGQPFLGKNLQDDRRYLHTIRDRMDERYDMMRAVRDDQYKYIRNYQSYKPWFQVINYMEQEHTMQELRRMAKNFQLRPEAAQFMATSKPLEEFYDLKADPHEVNNLIDKAENDPDLMARLNRLRSAHEAWVVQTRDTGLIPEAELEERSKSAGTRYAILQNEQAPDLLRTLMQTNRWACEPKGQVANLINAANHADSAVRYWAATGLGNSGVKNEATKRTVMRLLEDDNGSVLVAAARAAWQLGYSTEWVHKTLDNAARSDNEYLSLAAMQVIDEMDQDAEPLMETVRWVRSNGKPYPVRVAQFLLGEPPG